VDKSALIRQVESLLRAALKNAERTAADSRDAAAHLATPQEKRDDSRVALEFGALAKGHAARQKKLQGELEALGQVSAAPLPKGEPIEVGCVVEVEDGREGRTFFVLPVAAGSEITGPDGDGMITVITAASPMGRAVMGRCEGDSVEVQLQGDTREWTITYVV
jgi:transcription elongation GreA/GreB family factor